jgi:hypothetical protein
VTYALHPVHAQRLVALVEHVRTCTHPGEQTAKASAQPIWCVACGAVYLEGRWLPPAWLDALARQMEHWQLVQVDAS